MLGLHHSARQHRLIGADVLGGVGQTGPVDQAERVEIGTAESVLSDVEVLKMGIEISYHRRTSTTSPAPTRYRRLHPET